jgi:hypothetical protein
MLVSMTALASGAVETRFATAPQGTNKYRPITRASIGDNVVFIAKASSPDGTHQVVLKVFDGAGREAFTAQSSVEARGGTWTYAFGYGTKPRIDNPGTWWFVFELDGQPSVSRTLEVSP